MTIKHQDQLFIIELTKDHIQFIAQLIHLHLMSPLAGPLGEKVLKELVDQTDAAQLEPEKHQVYFSSEVMDKYIKQAYKTKLTEVEFKGIEYVPFENGDVITRPW